MERLTMAHITSIIDSEEYVVTEQYVQCVLMVGEAPVIGTSYRFSTSTHDPERAKIAARDDAIKQLFSLEAYHQKRLRKGTVGMAKSLAQATKDLVNHDRDVKLTVGGLDCQTELLNTVDELCVTETVADSARRIAELGKRTILAQPTQLQSIPDSTLASRLAEYENRLNEGGKACLYIESEIDIAELNELNYFFKPKHIHIRPDLKLDTTPLKGYCVVVEGRDGDYVLNV